MVNHDNVELVFDRGVNTSGAVSAALRQMPPITTRRYY